MYIAICLVCVGICSLAPPLISVYLFMFGYLFQIIEAEPELEATLTSINVAPYAIHLILMTATVVGSVFFVLGCFIISR